MRGCLFVVVSIFVLANSSFAQNHARAIRVATGRAVSEIESTSLKLHKSVQDQIKAVDNASKEIETARAHMELQEKELEKWNSNYNSLQQAKAKALDPIRKLLSGSTIPGGSTDEQILSLAKFKIKQTQPSFLQFKTVADYQKASAESKKNLKLVEEAQQNLAKLNEDLFFLNRKKPEIKEIDDSTYILRNGLKLSDLKNGLDKLKQEFEDHTGRNFSDTKIITATGAKPLDNNQVALVKKANALKQTIDVVFEEMLSNGKAANFLLTNFETLEKDLKNQDYVLQDLKNGIENRLNDTLMGEYINRQLKKTMLSICDLQSKCKDGKNEDLKNTIKNIDDILYKKTVKDCEK